MFKQIILSLLARLNSIDESGKAVGPRQIRVFVKLMNHEKKHPKSKLSLAFAQAEEELDDVEAFEESPKEFIKSLA